MIDVIEILIHWYAGRSQHELATSLGVDRKTIRKYTAPAVAAGMAPGGPPMDEADWAAAGDRVVPAAGRSPAAAGDLAEHRAAPRLHRRPAEGGGDGRRRSISGCATSTAWTRAWPSCAAGCGRTCPRRPAAAQVTVLGDAPPPGEEAQIDYGRLGMWIDPATGRRRRGVGVRDGAGLLAAHVRAAGAGDGPGRRGPPRTWRRSRSSAACPAPAGAGQPARPGWTGRTSTTRRSTARMPSWPPTTARWSTRPARASPRTSRRSSGRCRMCGTRSGAAGSSPRWPQMQAAALRWCREVAGRGRAGRWTAPPRRRCSPRSRQQALQPLPVSAVRAGDLVDGQGRPGHPRQGRQARSTRCRGGSSGDRVDARSTPTHGAVLPPRPADRDPRRARTGASRPTWATTRRRRSRSTCAPRPGAAAAPPRSARPASRSSTGCWSQRPVPAARRPGRPRPGRQARPGPARGRLRQGDRGR